jgi:hypothetical protein
MAQRKLHPAAMIAAKRASPVTPQLCLMAVAAVIKLLRAIIERRGGVRK